MKNIIPIDGTQTRAGIIFILPALNSDDATGNHRGGIRRPSVNPACPLARVEES